MALTNGELQSLIAKCNELRDGPDYQISEYVPNLLNTVLDFQMNSVSVSSAMDHFKKKHDFKTHDELKVFLNKYGHKVLIEVKSHTGDQSYFELGSSELDAAQEALETGDSFQVWVIRNLDGSLDIDHLSNPMQKENRKLFRFEVGRVYYQTG